MSPKFRQTVFAVLIILFALAALPWFLEKISPKKTADNKNLSVNLSSFTRETTEKIAIKKEGEEKILFLENDLWKIDSQEADQEKVKSFFEDLARIKIKEMASENESNHARFEVTRELGTELRLVQNGKESVFYIGKAGAGTEDFYLRKDGLKNVYLVSGAVREKVLLPAADWKKKEETPQEKEKK